MKNPIDISKPTNTICKEIIDYFKTTNENSIATAWGSGCIVIYKLEENNKIKFYVGFTKDWLGRLKQYSDIFDENTSPDSLFKFCNISYTFLSFIKNDQQVREVQASNFCEAIRENMKKPDFTKYLMKRFKF